MPTIGTPPITALDLTNGVSSEIAGDNMIKLEFFTINSSNLIYFIP